jgi:hypothetical protein
MIGYTGPSWAALSYDVPGGDWNDYTNLALEWGCDVINESKRGSRNLSCLSRIKQHKLEKIIWIYCEPLVEIKQGARWKPHANRHNPIQIRRFLQCSDPYSFRLEIAEQELKEIAKLDADIALIGSHSDVFTEIKYPDNITIICNSWQKFMDPTIHHGWGVEVANNMIKEYLEIKPSIEVVDYVYEQWQHWKLMEDKGLFVGNHPNRKSTELFAEYTKLKVEKFINS